MICTILLGVIGGPELTLIIVAALLLFGGKKIPELMRGLGQGVRAFKEGQEEAPQQERTEQDKNRPD